MHVRTRAHNPGAGAAAMAPAPAPPVPGGEASVAEGLVRRARAGDRAAFAAIYREHGPMVHALLLARVPPADADDLTQEVFLLAWRRLGELRDGGALRGWLAAIARTCVADFARSNGRRQGREAAAARAHAGAEPGEDSRAGAEAVLGLIRALPEAYREPLTLRFIAGLNGPQIAACLGMTPGSVRVNLHRGYVMLREKLSEDAR